MNIYWKAMSVGLAIAMLAGCVVRERAVERVVVDRPAPVVRHQPALIVETIPSSPGANYAWVPGHWVWRENNWAWSAGHWHAGQVRSMPPIIVEEITMAPSPRHYWVPGHWKFEGDWVWVRGRWHS
jgi:hypothetical protein